mmetsp:Transcript_20679/g.52345  ORF Transcript_20679/g.52345 Transcript_20679/m.52345 type:complete len:685 (-) Transcript_20679:26-2080(-)
MQRQHSGGGGGGGDDRFDFSIASGAPNRPTRISPADRYSPIRTKTDYSYVWAYRVGYILMLAVGMWYFVWLCWWGRNDNALYCWIPFLVAEILTAFSTIPFYFNLWSPKERKWRSLNEFPDAFPVEYWPPCDMTITHYKEPVEELEETVDALMSLVYPPDKLNIYVLDDGHYTSPNTPVASAMGKEVLQMVSRLTGVPPRKEVYENPPRDDCAVEVHTYVYDGAANNLPTVTVVCRVKPKVHHNKAGNINNFLFNVTNMHIDDNCVGGDLIGIFDNDMRPVPDFLLRIVPFFFNYHKDPRGPQFSYIPNYVGFVQTPQRFIDLTIDDYLAAGNMNFFDGIEPGRDGFGLTAFAGTNVLWRRRTLGDINGFTYGSITEDMLTGMSAHSRGWLSVYGHEDLTFGTSPQTVAAAMMQRLRWSKGSVEILLNEISCFCCKPDVHVTRIPSTTAEEYLPRQTNPFVRMLFYVDSTFYPFVNVSAMLYVWVALVYLVTGQSPINPDNSYDIIYTFLLFYIIKFGMYFLGFRRVPMLDVWRNQQVYWSYSFVQFMSIVQGIWERLAGGGGGWFNTGAGIRTVWLEWYPITIFILLVAAIIYRFIIFFFFDKGCNAWVMFSAVFYGLFILSNIFPFVSMSIYERVSTKPDAERENRVMTLPMPIFASLFVITFLTTIVVWSELNCDDPQKAA